MEKYINADLLKDEILSNAVILNNPKHLSKEDTLCVIDNMPTTDVVEVKHGEWLPQIVLGERVWDCSECKTLGSPHWKRCPICEAKMDGRRDT